MPTSKAAPADALDHPAISDTVRALARRGELRTYRKGTLLIQEGDVGDTIYVIVSGRLRTFGSNPDSGREITYGTYGPGEYLGEMGLDGLPRSASVVALEQTVCAVITRPTLEAHLKDNPGFAFELIAKVIRRARAATMSAKQMALNDVYGRLKFLLETSAGAPDADGRRVLAERITHQAMADQVGCTREMVSRVLKDLEIGGYVTKGGDGRLVLSRALPLRW